MQTLELKKILEWSTMETVRLIVPFLEGVDILFTRREANAIADTLARMTCKGRLYSDVYGIPGLECLPLNRLLAEVKGKMITEKKSLPYFRRAKGV